MMAAETRIRFRTLAVVFCFPLVGFTTGCTRGPEVLRFAAMGDMGTGGPGQRAVATMMAERAEEEPLHFWLALGDNIYPWGVLSPTDTLWDRKFEEIYDFPSLEVPVYGTLGNHDYLGFPLAQVQRSDLSARWSMPDRYYSFSQTLADGTQIEFFALDTEAILSSLEDDITDTSLEERTTKVRRVLERWEVELPDSLVEYMAERIHVEDGWTVARIALTAERTEHAIDRDLIDEVLEGSGTADYPTQLEWLRQGLSASTAEWRIVFGHQPIYSHNPWREASPEFLERLEPILVDGEVDIYLAAHDHYLDMMKPVQGVHHVTSGAGSGSDSPYEFEQSEDSHYTATGGGFTLFQVRGHEIVIEFVDLEGVTRHSQVIPNPSGSEVAGGG